MKLLWLLLVLSTSACGGDPVVSEDDLGAPDSGPAIGPDAAVTAFDQVLFDSAHRENDRMVTLPDGLFRKVTLHLQLDCPTKCDAWDRLATLGLVGPDPDGDGGASEPVTELARFVTPFGIKGAWDLDVTDLQPLLRGPRTLRAKIDTWVAAGSPYGNGWLLTATLVYEGGVPVPEPLAVLPLGWHDVPLGDPAQPLATSLPPQPLVLPDGASHGAVRLLVTGHGQGNQDNCGEFCALEHRVTVDGSQAAGQLLWRDDCASNPVHPQKGTWQLERAGWCPGSTVTPWTVPVQPARPAFTIGYEIDAYVNACRPGACDTKQCSLGSSCDFDGGAHTPPFYALSALFIAYR